MKTTIIPYLFLFLLLAGCSTLTLKQGDFSWPIESVSKVDDQGMIADRQFNISFNVKELLFNETKDSVNVSNVTLRIIRDVQGYYFITAKKFKNVYVFMPIEGGLRLSKKILVSNKGLEDPAFNQRPPVIQLLDELNPPMSLTHDGILEGESR
jgi:hypothetical protein